QAEFLEKGIQRGLALCRLQGAYGRFKIAARTDDSVTLENGKTFASTSLAKLLANSGEVLLMACTAGKPPMEAIAAELENSNAALALILDATASQKA
ncbi:TPA: methionine synthase, partial [Candidatus Sumerlaeota bacterium]|nr:methionine synthase [Candidatus Sumerlaeota bacterium]